MKKATVLSATLGLLILSLGGYLLRNDIFGARKDFYILENSTYTTSSSIRGRGQIVLLKETPLLRSNKIRHMEEVFWSNITLDSLSHYRKYRVTYYRESEYLTKDFKAGGQYNPIYSYWDNTMDWRNHREDNIGQIYILTRKDGSVIYCTDVFECDWGILSNTFRWKFIDTEYSSLQELYTSKCKEFGIHN